MQSYPNLPEDNEQLKVGTKVPDQRLFQYELGLVCIAVAVALIYAIWPVLIAPNNSYPVTTDGMGHLTRVKYLAECFKDLKWPSWFPYWYNGSTAIQYYPPISFFCMAAVEMIIDNIKVSFELLVFISQFIGSLGVWFFCYRFIGRWVGITGAVLYALQPFLLRTLILQGAIAQGPVFAFTPWLLYFTMLFIEKKTPVRWLLICLTSTLLTFSHPMHFYIIGLCMGIFIIVMTIQRKADLEGLILWCMALVLGIGIGAFWAVPGITHLENPLVPYLLPESSAIFAVKSNWFNPIQRNTGNWYPGLAVYVISLVSIFILKNNKSKHIIISLLISLIVGLCFSLGYSFPLFNYLPMHQSLITMRFISICALTATILVVYMLNDLVTKIKAGSYMVKILNSVVIAIIILGISVDIYPRMMPILMDEYTLLQQSIKQVSITQEPFEQGRISWLSQSIFLGCQIAYFPMLAGLNMADGWSIEGTSHNRTIWLHNIAIKDNNSDYVMKNLLLWNVRSAFVDNEYNDLHNNFVSKGFQELDKNQTITTFYNPAPSSYFMKQERDAIAIGLAAPGMVMNFPWMVQGRSVSLEDYNPKELAQFKLIYLIEPDVKDFKKFQKIVNELAEEDKTIIVSMGRSITWPLDDIIPYWETIQSGAVLVPTPGSPINYNVALDPDPNGRAPAMGNLDEVWMELHEGDKRVPVVGYKNIGDNRIYYVGLSLGQQLNSGHGTEIKKLMEQMMDIAHPNKNFVPAAFPVTDAVWGHDGFSFSYNNQEPSSVLVSVTYTPRWKAKVDGKDLEVSQLENLILVDLPAGSHTVSFHYGMTWVGWLGIVLSIFSLLIVIYIYRRFDDLDRFFAFINKQIKRMVEGVGA